MAVRYFDSPSVPLSYEQLTQWGVDVARSQNVDLIQYLNFINGAYPDADLSYTMLEETAKYLDFYQNNDGTYTVLGAYTDIAGTETVNPLDSNSTKVARGTVKQAINHGTQEVGGVLKRNMTPFPIEGSFASQAAYIVGSVTSAIGAVSTGISLGKWLSNAIYENAPNYWPDMDWSSYNPETWNSITNGDDSPYANALNFILGLDPDTGNSQAYMDETTYAYMAYLLSQNQWFEQGSMIVTNYTADFPYITRFPVSTVDSLTTWTSRISLGYRSPIITASGNVEFFVSTKNPLSNIKTIVYVTKDAPNRVHITAYSDDRSFINSLTDPYNVCRPCYHRILQNDYNWGAFSGVSSYTKNGMTVYYTDYYYVGMNSAIPMIEPAGQIPASNVGLLSWYAQYGTIEEESIIPGLSNQPNATLPDTRTWSDVPATLQSLQQQYPDLWADKLVWEQLQPDGTVIPTTYIPVPLPDAMFNADTQPTATTATQANPTISPDTDTLTKLFTQIATATQMQTAPDTDTVPENPPDTGDGSSPTPIPPTGSASALWSVYHPTAAQINSFGAWLWTDNIIQQFVQALNSPIDGIITLHKIYATPIDSGQGTIVIGRLDSEVPTALVTEQYVQVDCGTVSLQEQFGNVFDYIGTDVSIYLPFIGIVKLNTSDVMRSTIGIKYNVDVFTGACLAMISVLRDGRESVLYQYTGMCSVEYPLTGGQHSGLINGIMGAVNGLISTGAGIAAANPLAIAGGVMGVAGGATSMISTQNARSGTFAANAGAMGVKKPYIIIERPQTRIATNDESYTGYSTNASVLIGSCAGMVKCRQVHVTGINATAKELDMINALLTSGILV